VRRVTAEVLARAEFVEARPSLWQRVLSAVGDFVGQILELLGGGGRGSVIGTLILLGLCAVAAVLLWHFSRKVQRDPASRIATTDPIGRSSRQWRAEAGEHEAAGRWRAAVRCSYRALIAELAAAGLLEEVPGRTSGEYLRVVADDLPLAAAAFTAATRVFESAWYGHADVSGDDVRQLRAASQRVLAATGGRRVGAGAAT
jgi:predicted lipid-binding transport protein (Tim44 family)